MNLDIKPILGDYWLGGSMYSSECSQLYKPIKPVYNLQAYYACVAVIKTGSAGLIAYRLLSRDSEWVWLQTSARVVYKNSKPEFIIAVHRHLTYVLLDCCQLHSLLFTQRYNICPTSSWMFSAASVCLCVRQHDNFRTSKHRMMKLGSG